jgi:dolichol kinase
MGKSGNFEELKSELLRKGIHLTIAFVPSLAALNRSHTALLLLGGIFLFVCAESLRFLGFSPPLVSSITGAALRKTEEGHFTFAPITLGLGALLSLILFPPQAAAAAIYALAFGDSASSLVGKFLGKRHPAILAGKSLEGCLACFITASLAGFLVFNDWEKAAFVGLASMLVDILPIEDFDNLLMPLAAGFAVTII